MWLLKNGWGISGIEQQIIHLYITLCFISYSPCCVLIIFLFCLQTSVHNEVVNLQMNVCVCVNMGICVQSLCLNIQALFSSKSFTCMAGGHPGTSLALDFPNMRVCVGGVGVFLAKMWQAERTFFEQQPLTVETTNEENDESDHSPMLSISHLLSLSQSHTLNK